MILRRSAAEADAQSDVCRGRRRFGKLKSACLAAGLSAAWAGNAEGAMFRVSVTPNQTISNARIYYHNGVTTSNFIHLGLLPANVTSVFEHTVTIGGFDDSYWFDTSFRNPGYVIIGLNDDEGHGVTVSFPNDDVVVNSLTWEETFDTPDPFDPDARVYTEEEVIATLENDLNPTGFVDSYEDFYAPEAGRRLPYLVTYFGEESTLVSFSTAGFGGTAIVEEVPEPSTFVLVVTSAGVLALACRRQAR